MPWRSLGPNEFWLRCEALHPRRCLFEIRFAPQGVVWIRASADADRYELCIHERGARVVHEVNVAAISSCEHSGARSHRVGELQAETLAAM